MGRASYLQMKVVIYFPPVMGVLNVILVRISYMEKTVLFLKLSN